MKKVKNIKGFTFIEIAVCIVVLSIVSIISLGNYTAFLNNSDDIVSMINSKIITTKTLGVKTPLDGYKNNIVPYLRINNNQIIYLELEKDYSLSEHILKYGQNINANSIQINIIGTGLVNNTIYFNSQGQPVDSNGNNIPFVIKIRKTLFDKSIQEKNINVNKFGTITISNG